MAILMDGEALASALKKQMAKRVAELRKRGVEPSLASVLVGEDPGSTQYVRMKGKDCKKVGIGFRTHRLSKDVSEQEVLKLVDALNADQHIHGILVQLPLPKNIDRDKVIARIAPEKDVDGLHPLNVGNLWAGTYDAEKDLLPCTPKGIMALLKHHNIALAGKRVVIINRSELVGKPLVKLMLDEDATVTVCHSKTKEPEKHTKAADVVVTAVGRRPNFMLTADMVKKGAVVVDVGVNRVNGKLCGDADFESVKKKASCITPVPGGVGPMTRVMLLSNVLIAAERKVKA